MPTDAHAIHPVDWADFQKLLADYRSGRLGGKPPRSKNFQPAGRSNIRVILLDDLEFGSSVDAAVTTPELTNEVQRIQFMGEITGGTFQIGFPDDNGNIGLSNITADLDYDATADEVREALEALPNLSSGDIVVTAYEGLFVVEFTGQYAGEDVPLLQGYDNLTGDSPNIIVELNTIWEDTGRTETVYAMLPTGSPTPMKSGAAALAHWYHGLGYGVHAVECRDYNFDDTEEY